MSYYTIGIFDIWLSYDINKTRLPIFGHTFLAITQPFVGQLGWKLLLELVSTYWDLYLSIGDEKSKLWYLYFIFDFLGHFLRENGRGQHVHS